MKNIIYSTVLACIVLGMIACEDPIDIDNGFEESQIVIDAWINNNQSEIQSGTISLGKADILNLDSIKMSANFSTDAISTDTDVTDRFELDNGQRDNFYDISRLVRKKTATAPRGRLLVVYDFFAHSAGEFFSVDSYSDVGGQMDYDNIPTYTARVFAADGCATDIAINIADMNLVDGYNIGFNQKSFAFSTPDNTNNAVNISYTNEQGVFYTSSTIGQILPFKFEILEITDYEINELGDPTWQIKASFDCILFGNKGGTRRIKNGNAVFAVSH